MPRGRVTRVGRPRRAARARCVEVSSSAAIVDVVGPALLHELASAGTRPEGCGHVVLDVEPRRPRGSRLGAEQQRTRLVLQVIGEGSRERACAPEVLDGGTQRAVGPPLPGGNDDDDRARRPAARIRSATHRATAPRLRNEAATTSAPASASARLIVEPFGEGSTRSATPVEARIDPGDRLTRASAPARTRP